MYGLPDRLIAFYKKTDLTTTNQNNSPQFGQAFEPLLNYIEGYAYDETGKILAFAHVGFRQYGTEKIVYITTADNQGFFSIPTNYLPSFGYELIFTPPYSNKQIVYNTSKFIELNGKYLKDKGLNLITKINHAPLLQKKT